MLYLPSWLRQSITLTNTLVLMSMQGATFPTPETFKECLVACTTYLQSDKECGHYSNVWYPQRFFAESLVQLLSNFISATQSFLNIRYIYTCTFMYTCRLSRAAGNRNYVCVQVQCTLWWVMYPKIMPPASLGEEISTLNFHIWSPF